MEKSSVEEIRARFDAEVERFSNVEIGQQAAMDSVVCLKLICRGIALAHPQAADVLDVGCGAGNWTVKLLQRLPKLNATLLDLSRPMLDRAEQRVREAGAASVTSVQGDVRGATFKHASFDAIVAGAVLHHLRGDADWRGVFVDLYRWLRPGGSVWIYDLVEHESPVVKALMRQRYGEHLEALKGPEHRDRVFAYSDREDTPRPVNWQAERLRDAGFEFVDIIHKNGPFAVICAFKHGSGPV